MEWNKHQAKVKVLSFGRKRFYLLGKYLLGKGLSYRITNYYLNFLKVVLYNIQCLTFMMMRCNNNAAIIVFCLILLF
ncbi:hypothetical protein VIGAN_07235400 [Vigna angularis var. angularis]|uniref:Uncharacterized protein n=1 Tax=Vigna angularis var. angularis TaxID=157739 RepID=A0A0S3SKR4_PHAAN|nr:hypothetical protein VIGAN_07235400 [Vigna angularis var. angularis]